MKNYIIHDECGDDIDLMNREEIEEMILNYHDDMGFDTKKSQLKKLSIKQLSHVCGGFGKSIEEIIE